MNSMGCDGKIRAKEDKWVLDVQNSHQKEKGGSNIFRNLFYVKDL